MPKSKERISDSEEESSAADSEEEFKPKKNDKGKKKRNAKQSDSEDSEESEKEERKPKKKAKTSDSKKDKPKKDENGDPMWELGNNKRITCRHFKGKLFVDIREMYEKDGEIKPGKKGICMNLENWSNLMDVFEEVNETVKNMRKA